jgi:ribosome-associated toxin RatA of RatAB toxin-antitoxin module
MAHAEIHEVIAVDKDKFYETVVRYEEYPKFVEGCTQVKVERKGPGKARVSYKVSLMKDVNYTLDHEEDPANGVVRWTLVDSDFFKKNTGCWEIKPAGAGKSDVRYDLEVEFKIPVPGFVLNRLVKGSLPGMLRNFEKQALK